jgi:hypothetical protein
MTGLQCLGHGCGQSGRRDWPSRSRPRTATAGQAARFGLRVTWCNSVTPVVPIRSGPWPWAAWVS